MIRSIARETTNNFVRVYSRKSCPSLFPLSQYRFQSSQPSTELSSPSTPLLKAKETEQHQDKKANGAEKLVTPKLLENYWIQVRSGLSQIRKLADKGRIDIENMTKITEFLLSTYYNFQTGIPNSDNELSRSARLVLTIVIRDLTYKVLDGKIKVDETALHNLFKLYSLLGLEAELVYIWKKSLKSNELRLFATSGSSFELVLPMLLRDDFDFETINNVYLSLKENELATNNIKIAMVPIYLIAKETEQAISLFSGLFLSELEPSVLEKGVNDIIRNCKDLETAELFLKQAQELNVSLRDSALSELINNIFIEGRNFETIKTLWGKLINHREKSSINDSFIKVFFEKYNSYSPKAFEKLKEIINTLKSKACLNEQILGLVVYKASSWRNSDVFNYLLEIGNHEFSEKPFHLTKAYLSASGFVDVDSGIILDLFRELIDKSNSYRMTTEIWEVVRDSTVNSPYLFSFNEPNKRIDVYFKLWKLCSPYLNNLDAFKSYIYEDIKLNPKYSKIYINLPLISVDFDFPEVERFKRNASIVNYMG